MTIFLNNPSGGLLTNVRLAKTANYTVANADRGKTIALGGSAFFTLTFSAASGYDSDFAVIVTNEDTTVSGGTHTGRNKTIAIDGQASITLWPAQTMIVFAQNNVWRYRHPGRWVVQGLPTLYVNHASGSDTTGDGLSTGAAAFATIQKAINVYEYNVDCNGFGPTIQVAAETFTENNVSHTRPLTGYHVISLTGDTATPANCVWQVSGSGNVAVQCRDTGAMIVTGFKFVSTGSGNIFINGGQDGICDWGYLEFAANGSGQHINVSPGGAANWFGGAITVSANMGYFAFCAGEGHLLMDGATISVPNALTFNQWIYAVQLAYVSATSQTYTGTGAGAGSTGAKYFVDSNSVLQLASTTLPGATAGSVGTNGKACVI